MSIGEFAILAIVVIGWYVITEKRKQKPEEIEEVPTVEKILKDTDDMYKVSCNNICEMYNKSRKELSNIHKSFLKEIKSNNKITKQGEKANVK